MTGIGTQIKNALGWFLTRLKGNVVNNLTSTSTDLPLSAAKGKDLQDQITSLNTNSIGYNQMAYVTFAPLGDNWWISSPVPCHTADKFNIRLSDNIKNSTSNNKSELSQNLFEVRKYKNYFYILTNDTSVAGYTFGTMHPGIVWEVYFSVIKS